MATDLRLPAWAHEMSDLFKSGSVAQFLIHGNVFDLVPAPANGSGKTGRMLPLKTFFHEIMFASYDVVLSYDRSKGILAVKGADDWGDWLEQISGTEAKSIVRHGGMALEMIDRYLLRTLNLQAIGKTKAKKIAVVIDFAEFVVPRGDPIQLSAEFSSNVVKVLSWANDPAILHSNIATVLVAEGLHDLNELIVENPRAAKLRIPLPGDDEMAEYIQTLQEEQFKNLPEKCEVPMDVLARRLTGLSRIGALNVVSMALNNGRSLTAAYLSSMKKDLIERECQGLLEFLESPYTLDNIAGHQAVKAWLRDDTTLLKRMALHALPMGYLIAGRIGTGKTFIVQCWAGELGIPCVVFKNFRDKWIGATESNLEKIFAILRALGQVVVFVDEADQAAGKRDGEGGDSGLSGRVYSMLAKEMSDTRNRGKIVWVFATSRPDLLEVDLKRQGRLDVHIPLFAPETSLEMHELLLAVAKKLNFPLAEKDLPEFPPQLLLGGNEVEGMLVRALRQYELSGQPHRPIRDILIDVAVEIRPSAHTRKLEYMDLVAVKECTDRCFLPERFAAMSPEQIESRLDELRRFI